MKLEHLNEFRDAQKNCQATDPEMRELEMFAAGMNFAFRFLKEEMERRERKGKNASSISYTQATGA